MHEDFDFLLQVGYLFRQLGYADVVGRLLRKLGVPFGNSRLGGFDFGLDRVQAGFLPAQLRLLLLLRLVGRAARSDGLRLGRRACLVNRPLLGVIGVVAVVDGHSAVLHHENTVGQTVDESAVVRDYQHRAGVVRERVLERLPRVQIEVVRRLVEQQKIVAREHRFMYHQPRPLAARESRHGLEHVVVFEQKRRERRADLALSFVGEAVPDLVQRVL